MNRPSASKPLRQWGLFNYDILWMVGRIRADCHKEGVEVFGNEPEYRKALKEGSMRVVRVTVREGWE